ncbi:MAG: stage III sporulation protein AF, partial [Oscillospiraceae bacterium]
MMLQFKAWAFALCAASVAAALLQMLLPKNSQQKTVTTVVNLFLLLCLLSPLSSIKASQSFSLEPIPQLDVSAAQDSAHALVRHEVEA